MVDAERARLTRSAALASMSVALLLVGLKVWAAWRTGSTAMLGSLADTALDLVASFATLIGVWFAAQPADHDHRFGHGKAEALAAMFQVVLIAISATAIIVRSAMRLIAADTAVEAPGDGILVSGIAIVATIGLLAWQRYVIARTRSVAIHADHVHYQSDILLNFAVIVALLLESWLGLAGADPVFGFAIALWLLWGGFRAATEAVDQLLDREWPDEKRLRFVELAARHPELSNLHDLRTRSSGSQDFVQFHVDLPGNMTVEQAHEIIERVESDLCAHFPEMELLIHIDPMGHVDEPDNPLVEQDEFEALEDKT
ncbi:cation diffusion facilitator family transporter [Pseudoblastomonas halimionae]|uniref:Cation diffusion facilitator family transporter n=1 Tax=Alteriqipengyuania halimionae TaxID=1926630 RepID=A0A6I4U6B0_9SPHN|nr:cation diffusion facilitator family transporter [Alteriqipengyuania halimionae]MXP10934.1 cation diffusion facilitator family transporter [Alteriqipengyuania halimionae]